MKNSFSHIRYGFSAERKNDTPKLINQIHGDRILTLSDIKHYSSLALNPPDADGIMGSIDNSPLYVFTADCVSLLLFTENPMGPVAALHSGWRSTLKGIALKALELLKPFGSIHAVLGPCIRNCCFEVRQDFIDQFEKAGLKSSRFITQKKRQTFFSLDRFIIEDQLAELAPQNIHLSNLRCTFCSEPVLPSFRRNGNTNSSIRAWITKSHAL